MRKSYVTPSILLLPLQIIGGPNAGVSGEGSGGMKPIGAKDGAFDEEELDMKTGWLD
mgnify:CR=1 FL=1